jgi:regulator of cell morphogenesis and NO signaling
MNKLQQMNLIPETKLAEAVESLPALLPIMERFGLPLGVGEHTIQTMCADKGVDINVFLFVSNLYLSGEVSKDIRFESAWLPCLLRYLQQSHNEYLEERYPEIKAQIRNMQALNENRGVKMVGHFFEEYMKEVNEHLDYENNTVFPYILQLVGGQLSGQNNFSVDEYKEHHDAIQEKLADLKNLLVRHLPVENDGRSRRILLEHLFKLEFDLHIHSMIEDHVLIPLLEKLENERK